jgi:hypothetical protein
MKIALAGLLLFMGCVIEPPDQDYPPSGGDTGWGSGWGGSGGTTGYGCQSDAACGSGYVCARNGECTTAANVRFAHATWTMHDLVATDATCTSAPKLDITFQTSSGGETFGFSPVPCSAGKYTIDKLPTRFTIVTLARAGDYYGGASATIDAQGNAAVNLPY